MPKSKQPKGTSAPDSLNKSYENTEDLKPESWNHIELRGRRMLHPPWISVSSGRKQFKLQQSPQTLQEVINEFLSEGGSEEQLCSLLNDHMPAPEFIFDAAELKSTDRLYSLEFYFYLFTFCKILLNDPEFCYKNGSRQLDIHHYILEKGKLEYPPWKMDDQNTDGYLSIANIRAIFVFVENAFRFDDEVIGEHTGMALAEEVLDLINRYVDEPYRVDRSFFNKEEVLVSFEYLFTITSIFELLMNAPDLISGAYRFGTLNNHHLAQAVFLLAGKSPGEKMKEWVLRTNNVYDFEFSEKKYSLEIQVDASRAAASGMFGHYEANCFRGIRQAFPAIFSAFMEIAKDEKNKTRLTCVENEPYKFRVRVKWIPPLALYLKTAGLVMLITAAGLFLLRFLGGYIPPFLFAFIIAALIGTIWILFKKYRSEKLINDKTKTLISTQLNSLHTITRELVEEKENLNETVKSRTIELQTALEKLKTLDKSKTNFIANVSHELRTPISLISIPIEEIQKGLYGEQINHDDRIFKLIGRNTLRLQRQIKQLLDFTQLDLGVQPLRTEPVNLPKYCKGLLVELDSLAAAKGVSLGFENHTDLDDIVIDADVPLLETMMLNLLSNGIKFSQKGSVKIQLVRDVDEDKIRICVKDTGIGFPEEFGYRLFDRFFQLEENENRRYEGTGIGLALVKKIADLHKWKIEAKGCPGKGACFTLSMPLSNNTADTPAQNNEIKKSIKQLEGELIHCDEELKTRYNNNKEKILIIDDNPDMASILTDILNQEYPVEWSPGGAQAVQQLLSEPGYSLVICDMMMPEMSGLELRRKFLESKQNEDIPFIFLTALADKSIKQQALETGGVDYITKPFSSEELKLKIHNLIETNRHQYIKAVRDLQGSERLMNVSKLETYYKSEYLMDLFNVTKGEKKILNLLKDGLQDKEIADSAGISVRTVSTHLRNMYIKTGTQNRVELINKLFPQD